MQMTAKDLAWIKGQSMWKPGADTLLVLDRAKEAGYDDAHPHLTSFVLGYYDAASADAQTVDANVPISEAERIKRQAAVDFARRSVGYEGFVVSPYAEALNALYVNGEITIAQGIQALDALYKK